MVFAVVSNSLASAPLSDDALGKHDGVCGASVFRSTRALPASALLVLSQLVPCRFLVDGWQFKVGMTPQPGGWVIAANVEQTAVGTQRRFWSGTFRRNVLIGWEFIKLIIQVRDDVLRLTRGEFFFCRVSAVAHLLFQRIQRLNELVLAGVNAGIVASHAVSVIQALPVGAVARQFGGVSARHQPSH